MTNVLALVVGPEITTAMPITVGRDGNGAATIGPDRTAADSTRQSASAGWGTRDVSLRANHCGHQGVSMSSLLTHRRERSLFRSAWMELTVDHRPVGHSAGLPQLSGDDHMTSRDLSVEWCDANQGYLVAEFSRPEAASWGRT